MRNILYLTISCLLFNLFLPWWSNVIPCLFFGAWLSVSPKNAIVLGFSGGGLAWLLHALFIHLMNNGILSGRIADMMNAGSPLVVLLITFFIGAVIGGSSAIAGFYFKQTFRQPEHSVHDQQL
jgi:hypothetical protein